MNSIPLPLAIAIAAVVAYFIGGMPFGYWFVRVSIGKDIRSMGSGNIGATNVHRSVGRKAGLIVLILDILKGFIAVWIAALLTGTDPVGLGCAAVAVILGHCYPALLGFRGGKGVACFVGAFSYLAPLALICAIAIFILVVALTKYISLGSIFAALLFPLFVWLLDAPLAILVASLAAAILIIYRHRANIARLRSGKEHIFLLKGGRP